MKKILFTFLVSILLPHLALAVTYDVTSFDDLPDDQTACPAAGGLVCTLRRAVIESNFHNTESNTIQLHAGTYRLTRGIDAHTNEAINEITGAAYTLDFDRAVDNYDEDDNVAGDLDILGGSSPSSITIISGAGAYETIIDASGMVNRYGDNNDAYRSRLFHVRSGYAKFSDVTIEGGLILRHFDPGYGVFGTLFYTRGYSSSANGGGILINPSASVIMQRVLIQGNALEKGCGAGVANYGTLSASQVTFTTNFIRNRQFADRGGLLSADVYYNSSGGGFCNVGVANLRDVSFIGNQARLYGGGIYNTGTLLVHNGSFYLNGVSGVRSDGDGDHVAGWGGAVANFGAGSVTLKHVTISQNVAVQGGGALGNYDPDLASYNSSISMVPGTNINISNSVISGNTTGSTSPVPSNCFLSGTNPISAGYNFSTDDTCRININASTDQHAVLGPFDSLPGAHVGLAAITCDYLIHTSGLPDWVMTVVKLALGAGVGPNPAQTSIPPTSCNDPNADQRTQTRLIGGNCDAGTYQSVPGDSTLCPTDAPRAPVPPDSSTPSPHLTGSGGASGTGGSSGTSGGSGGMAGGAGVSGSGAGSGSVSGGGAASGAAGTGASSAGGGGDIGGPGMSGGLGGALGTAGVGASAGSSADTGVAGSSGADAGGCGCHMIEE